MHMNAPCTKCSIENAYECKQMHQYQNASYMNAYKCNNMQYHAEGDECIWMKCNENVKNASKCMNMHLNAYVKKQHTHGHTLACRARTQTPDRPEGGEGRECQGGEGGGQGGPAHVHGPCPRECIEGGLLRFRPGPSPYGCRLGPLAMRLGASGSLLRLSRRARTSP